MYISTTYEEDAKKAERIQATAEEILSRSVDLGIIIARVAARRVAASVMEYMRMHPGLSRQEMMYELGEHLSRIAPD